MNSCNSQRCRVRCSSFAEQLLSAADHIQSYLERADKKVSGTTYKELRELIERIDASGCFSKAAGGAEAVSAAADAVQQSVESAPAVESEPGIGGMVCGH